MKPAHFKQENDALRGGPGERYGTENEVVDLPIYRSDDEVISCWKGSWWERLRFLVTGRAWLRVIAQNHPPVEVTGKDPFL